MIECNACDGVGYFVWDVCSEPACCSESRYCEFCNGEGIAPIVVITDMPDWYDFQGFDYMNGKVSF